MYELWLKCEPAGTERVKHQICTKLRTVERNLTWYGIVQENFYSTQLVSTMSSTKQLGVHKFNLRLFSAPILRHKIIKHAPSVANNINNILTNKLTSLFIQNKAPVLFKGHYYPENGNDR